jgi:hypothetical protein
MTAAGERETPHHAARRMLAGALRDGFELVAVHEYRGTNGAAQFWKVRAVHPDGRKAIRPMHRSGDRFEMGEPPAPAAGRPLYHAAAVMASNLVMALADLAAETWARAGAPPAEALPALVPLLRGAVENLAERGLPGALTGPAARGDAEVVRRQVRALRGEARDAYRVLTRRLVEIAARGGLDRARAEAVRRAAGGTPRRAVRRQPR